MSSPVDVRALSIGSAARAALGSRAPARVFASFERSCYVETQDGIACVGGPQIGRGPLNVIVEGFEVPSIGERVSIDLDSAAVWRPRTSFFTGKVPNIEIPASIEKPARSFLAWLRSECTSPDELIGLGPGLTPSGDDFVGGALIALRAAGRVELAERVAAWALRLAERRTSRISRAHLACAAAGEGHEALHQLLAALEKGEAAIARALDALDRVGHSSGRDAAAGALLSLDAVWRRDASWLRT
jgi:hypothetical protein